MSSAIMSTTPTPVRMPLIGLLHALSLSTLLTIYMHHSSVASCTAIPRYSSQLDSARRAVTFDRSLSNCFSTDSSDGGNSSSK